MQVPFQWAYCTALKKRFDIKKLRPSVGAVCWAIAGAVPAAEDPGFRAQQQQQLERRQQEDALQLRMRQEQRATQHPPADLRERQALDASQARQRTQQRELHYRQSIERASTHPDDDEGTRRAKAELERRRAQLESEQQLQRMESRQPAP